MSPAIRLGATHLFAVGVRSLARRRLARGGRGRAPSRRGRGAQPARPPLAQICGVFLNAIFLDHLDADLDHLRRMNELVAAHADATGRDDARAGRRADAAA